MAGQGGTLLWAARPGGDPSAIAGKLRGYARWVPRLGLNSLLIFGLAESEGFGDNAPMKRLESGAVGDEVWRRRLKIAGLLVVLIASLALALQSYTKVARQMDQNVHIDAFDSYMKTVPAFIYAHQAYRSDRFPLPPLTLLFVAPYTLLSRPTAQAAWVLTKPFMFVPIFLLMIAMVRRAGVRLETLAVLLVAAGWFFPVIGDVQEGQMNLLMLLPLVLGLCLAQGETHRHQWAAGLMVALAICIKVTPLAFLAYFIYRRRWRIVLGILAGIGLWLFVVPAVVFSWHQNIVWLRQWTSIMILPYVTGGVIKFANGESIPELMKRLLEHIPAWQDFQHGHTVDHYVNIVNWSPRVVLWIWRGVLAGIAAAGMIWARRPLQSLQCRRYLMEIGCIGMFMLWASERTWVPHYVTLILALMATAMIASDTAAPEQTRRWAWTALIGVALLMPWTSDLAKIFGRDGRHYFDSMDVVLWASFLLAAVLITSRYPALALAPRMPQAPPTEAPSDRRCRVMRFAGRAVPARWRRTEPVTED